MFATKLKQLCIKYNQFLSQIRYSGQFQRSNISYDKYEIEEVRKVFLYYTQSSDFKMLRQTLIDKYRHINEVNVDAVIVGLCNSDHLKLAQNYIKFLNNEGIKTNNAIWGRLLKIYYSAYRNKTMTEANKQEILDIYKNIKTNNDILDPATCENLILGIVTTDEWKSSLEYLNMIKLTCVPNINVYSAIAARAFQDQDSYSIGYNLVNEMIENQKQPMCEIFIDFIKGLNYDRHKCIENLEIMFSTIASNDIVVSQSVIECLREKLNEWNRKHSLVSLTNQGKCTHCGYFMERISISTKEFNALRSSFLEKVLIRKDVFLKTTPMEVQYFLKFIDQHGPFHCIIDGLNVAYSTGSRNYAVCANLVASVVKYFCMKEKKTLVLGRKYMNKWPSDTMNYIKSNSKIFLTNDLSQDDPFILYAALKNGPATDFFSRDLMRSHAFLLGTELKSVFKKWQQEHQYSLITTTKKNEVIIKEPVKYNLYAHKINGIWHIPYREKYQINCGYSNDLSNSWLCVSI